MNALSATRALKNARRLALLAPHIVVTDEPSEGTVSHVPSELVARLHETPESELSAYPELQAAVRMDRSPSSTLSSAVAPLFGGTLHFVQVTFDPGPQAGRESGH